MAIQYTPSLGLPYPQVTDAPLIASRDLRALAQKMDSEGAQIRGESTSALTAAQAAEALAAQALARADAIEDPIHVGPDEPTGGEELWVDTDEDAPDLGGEVTSNDITDATEVGRNVLTAPLAADGRRALNIWDGTRAHLDEGTDTAERTWEAKTLAEFVASKAGGASSWDDLTGKPAEFPPEAHTHTIDDVTGLSDALDNAGGSVTSADISDASTVGRAILTAPLSVNARNALSIFTGTRALLDEGTDEAERTWDAKELHEYVTDQVAAGGGAASWDDLTGKPSTFPPSAHTHATSEVTGLADRLAALEYDSGERDITSLAGSRVTGGKFLLRRVGKLVTLSIVAVVPSSTLGSGSIILTIPSGFQRPSRWDGYIPASTTTNRTMFIFSTGGLGVWSPSASDSLRADLYWTTDNPIPATPPGDPT